MEHIPSAVAAVNMTLSTDVYAKSIKLNFRVRMKTYRLKKINSGWQSNLMTRRQQ